MPSHNTSNNPRVPLPYNGLPLRGALSEEFLEDAGWTVNKSGCTKNDKGRTIFAAGFVTALRKILYPLAVPVVTATTKRIFCDHVANLSGCKND